jgi:protein-disulfide isomerase
MRVQHKISFLVVAVLLAMFGIVMPNARAAEPSLLKVQGFTSPTGSEPVQLADANTGPRRENGDMVMGAANAPVTIIEYASLTCPHCASFHVNTLPKLKTAFIDTGAVKYVFRDFPLDRLALSAAMIAHCAGPERYFAYLDVFFHQQSSWTRGGDQEAMLAALKRLARLGGMSDAQIDSCLQNKQLQDSILATSVAGQNQYQVRSTPTLIINGERHAGALSFEELEKIIKPLAGKS